MIPPDGAALPGLAGWSKDFGERDFAVLTTVLFTGIVGSAASTIGVSTR